jgi:hypothetical protein
MISHLIFLVLFVTKIKLESTRVTIIFIIITQILMSLYCIFHTLPLLILYFTAQISTLFSIYFLPVYQYPTPSGPYNVGYKQIQNIYIYYPTDQIKSVDIKQIQGVDYIRRIYDSYQHIHKNRIPSIVLRVFL